MFFAPASASHSSLAGFTREFPRLSTFSCAEESLGRVRVHRQQAQQSAQEARGESTAVMAEIEFEVASPLLSGYLIGHTRLARELILDHDNVPDIRRSQNIDDLASPQQPQPHCLQFQLQLLDCCTTIYTYVRSS